MQAADTRVIRAFQDRGTSPKPSHGTVLALEHFVCQLYLPQTSITQVKEVRWWLFTKRQAQTESLPPTKDALYQGIIRAHYQCVVWNNDITARPEIPSSTEYGWVIENQRFKEVLMTESPAPEAVIHLIKCGCSKTKCTSARCKCKMASLPYTELCSCCESDELCENIEPDMLYYSEDES